MQKRKARIVSKPPSLLFRAISVDIGKAIGSIGQTLSELVTGNWIKSLSSILEMTAAMSFKNLPPEEAAAAAIFKGLLNASIRLIRDLAETVDNNPSYICSSLKAVNQNPKPSSFDLSTA